MISAFDGTIERVVALAALMPIVAGMAGNSGNQTLIRTSTGIWTVAYNAANRAVSFTSRDGATVVECGYCP